MIRIFEYIEELDCFIVDPDYKTIANLLGLTEWNEVVWIGRFFLLENDYGEHWFDNWTSREKIEKEANKLGFDTTELFILIQTGLKMILTVRAARRNKEYYSGKMF